MIEEEGFLLMILKLIQDCIKEDVQLLREVPPYTQVPKVHLD